MKSDQSSTHPSSSSGQFDQSSLRQTDSNSMHFEQGFLHAADISSHSLLSESINSSYQSPGHLVFLPADPLQPTRAKQPSPKQASLCSSQSAVEGDVSEQSSNFDQTISDQVNMLRDTLKSPTPCSSKMVEAEQVSSHVLESPRQADASSSEKQISKQIARNGQSNPFLEPESTISDSGTTQLIEEAMETHDIKDSDSSEQLNISNTQLNNSTFNSDNQLTVIPATNPFSSPRSIHTGPRLEELFKPITEDENVQKKVSYEVINADSGDQVQQTSSQTGELDMFTHLFQDEDTQEHGQ